jgi:hypothetical protein
MAVIDTSATDAATAAEIRAALADLVHQLPDYDSLTLVATADNVTIPVSAVTLEGTARDVVLQAIETLEFGGRRHIEAGIEAAAREAATFGPGSYDVLLVATGADATTDDDIWNARHAPPGPDGSSNVGIDLYAVAIGAGDHEGLLKRASTNYQWAASAADLPLALAPYRLVVSEATLLGVGPLPTDGSPATAIVGPSHFGVRFTAYSPGRSVGIEVESPDGDVYDVDSRAEGVTVQEIGNRVSIVVNGADEGEWRLRFTGPVAAAAGAWYEVEETLTETYSLVTAYGTGDTTDDLRFGVGILPGPTVKASARLVRPDGKEETVALGTLGQDELNIGGAIQILGAIVEKPEPAGSYRVFLDVDVTDAAGVRRVYHWIEGAYVMPHRDSDGDGITDSVELHDGLDAHDPADGAMDHDFDGLTTARELAALGTDPGEWDTDSGGESDGSEVAAGRNPLDGKDDQPAPTCIDLLPTPGPGATPTPMPAASAPPAPELEALLPDVVLGHPTQKLSMTAPQHLEYVFAIYDAFLACTGTHRSDLSLAIAVVNELNAWSVTAVRVDGVSGREMADIFLFRLTAGPTGGRLEKRTVDGREYWLSEVGWAVYATDKTFYWVTSFAVGYAPSPGSQPPLPPSQEIVEAIIRQLPLDR